MKIKNIYKSTVLFIFLLHITACNSDLKEKPEAPKTTAPEVVFLEQGWSTDEMLDFYNTPQGSQLIPYAWFLALQQTDNNELFRSSQHMQSFGYIPQDPLPGRNPDGLPVGFVKDFVRDDFLATALTSTRISSDPQAKQMEWLGLTCAACHTSQVQYANKNLRINGGQAQSDIQSFIIQLSKALTATVNNEDKLNTFANQVLAPGGVNATEIQALKTRINNYIVWLNSYIDMNYGGVAPYGYGRLDAFGAILNQITSYLLEIPGNRAPANASVSYPFLWNTSQLAWVQWNGSVSNHIARNVGEVTGVFAHTILKTDNPEDRFYSSAKINNLFRLEEYMSKLDSPKWAAPLPPIDQNKARKGKLLYAANCESCHSIRNAEGKFPMTEPNEVGKQFIKIHMSGLKEIGTDPLMAMNFINPALNVDPGQMRPYLNVPCELDKGPSEPEPQGKVQRAQVLVASGANIILKQLAAMQPPMDQQQKLALTGGHLCNEKAPNLIAYKARPLNGIWATAPYMHNGSMANLYQTLLPEAERESSFYVGGIQFDPVQVGFKSNTEGNHFLFTTHDAQGNAIPGNSNKGHSGNRFTKTQEENGQWRDFTEAERYQLIEYMKTL